MLSQIRDFQPHEQNAQQPKRPVRQMVGECFTPSPMSSLAFVPVVNFGPRATPTRVPSDVSGWQVARERDVGIVEGRTVAGGVHQATSHIRLVMRFWIAMTMR